MNTPNPLDTAIEAARGAGQIIRAELEKTQAIQEKANQSFTTATDTAAEEFIIKKIQAAFPDHGVFSEEIGQKATGANALWIIDPLDGTMNFIRRLPGVAVSIALVENNRVTLGVVYDVIHDKLFTAEAGHGAHVDGTKLRVSQETNLAETVVSFSRGSKNKERLGITFQSLNPFIRTPRIGGSTALGICATANGLHDAHIAHDCYLYDCVAPILIAIEAGATIIGFDGQPWQPDLTNPMGTSDFIVANEKLGQSLSGLLN